MGKYLKSFNNLMTAVSVTDAERKCASLLHYIGEEMNDIFETLQKEEITRILRKLEKRSRGILHLPRMCHLRS